MRFGVFCSCCTIQVLDRKARQFSDESRLQKSETPKNSVHIFNSTHSFYRIMSKKPCTFQYAKKTVPTLPTLECSVGG